MLHTKNHEDPCTSVKVIVKKRVAAISFGHSVDMHNNNKIHVVKMNFPKMLTAQRAVYWQHA